MVQPRRRFALSSLSSPPTKTRQLRLRGGKGMNILVVPGEADFLADSNRRLDEGGVRRNRRQVRCAVALEGDMIARTLIFDAAHLRLHPSVVGVRRQDAGPIGPHRDL